MAFSIFGIAVDIAAHANRALRSGRRTNRFELALEPRSEQGATQRRDGAHRGYSTVERSFGAHIERVDKRSSIPLPSKICLHGSS
jgi:hypothetical protein